MIYFGVTDSEKLRSNINAAFFQCAVSRSRSSIEVYSFFHDLALFTNVDLANHAKRNIQAIPRVA
jgi:hypothetical protein